VTPLASWEVISRTALDHLHLSAALATEGQAVAVTALLLVAVWGLGVLLLDGVLGRWGHRKTRWPMP